MDQNTLKNVFSDFYKENIFVNLDDTYCDTLNENPINDIKFSGFIYAISNIDEIYECINEEGSANVLYAYDITTPKRIKSVDFKNNRDKENKLKDAICQIFKNNGYDVKFLDYKRFEIVIYEKNVKLNNNIS